MSLQHNERDGEAEKNMMDTRGRGRGNALRTKGRFILRRATNTNTTNNTSPKWAHDKFQATDNDEGEQQGEDVEQDQWEQSCNDVKIPHNALNPGIRLVSLLIPNFLIGKRLFYCIALISYFHEDAFLPAWSCFVLSVCLFFVHANSETFIEKYISWSLNKVRGECALEEHIHLIMTDTVKGNFKCTFYP